LLREPVTRAIKFNKIRGVPDIVRAYGINRHLLDIVFSQVKCVLYEELRLPKKNPARVGEYRTVYKVKSPDIALLHKNIATSISTQCAFPDYVQGFVGKRSIATNASLHIAQDFILKADIIGFFEAITIEQITGVFENLGCNNSVAGFFAEICTLEGVLPQGLSTSPVLSNLVCEKMDAQLNSLGNRLGATYSRYADDITFSGAIIPSKEVIKEIFNAHGFEMHPHKFLRQKRTASVCDWTQCF